PRLEDQMCAFTTDFDRARAGYSPDRIDALVWGLTELLVEPMPNYGIFEYTRLRRFPLFGQLPGSNKLKAGSRLLVSPFPEIKFMLSCCGGAVKLVGSRRPVGK